MDEQYLARLDKIQGKANEVAFAIGKLKTFSKENIAVYTKNTDKELPSELIIELREAIILYYKKEFEKAKSELKELLDA